MLLLIGIRQNVTVRRQHDPMQNMVSKTAKIAKYLIGRSKNDIGLISIFVSKVGTGSKENCIFRALVFHV